MRKLRARLTQQNGSTTVYARVGTPPYFPIQGEVGVEKTF